MFALRGIAVTLSVFTIVYAVLSLVLAFTSGKVVAHARRLSVRRAADLLFLLRVSPLIVASCLAAGIAVPSFLLLEPRSIDEAIGPLSLLFGTCGFALCSFGVFQALIALRESSRVVAAWSRTARALRPAGSVPVLAVPSPLPPLTVAGIFHPRILLSVAAEQQLSGAELQAALLHELIHVRRLDNLKKLAMKFVPCVGTKNLEAAWLMNTEMAANEAAVSNAAQALDLAAALIKLSRITPHLPSIDLANALVDGQAATIRARVERLLAWNKVQRTTTAANQASWLLRALATFSALALFAVSYSKLLVIVHIATEWLVR